MEIYRSSLLILESPQGIELGLDNLTLKVGQLFKGVKCLPSGPHFLQSQFKSGKSSMFIYCSPDEVVVLKWKDQTEDFARLTQEEESAYSQSIQDFLPMMVKYPNESLKSWRDLTNYITKFVISKLEPIVHSINSEDKEYDLSAQELESFNAKNTIYYTSIPKRLVKHGMSITQVTEFNFDKSYILSEILQKNFERPEDFLGEFQFAYISFIIGEDFESFDQWKSLLVLFCNCDKALFTHTDFFFKFVPVLYSQVLSLPKDLVFDPLLGSSFITSSLKAFLSLLDNTQLDKKLKARGEKLKSLVKAKFSIDEFEMIDDDEAPCIVDCE